jgi:hypothetical protein
MLTELLVVLLDLGRYLVSGQGTTTLGWRVLLQLGVLGHDLGGVD